MVWGLLGFLGWGSLYKHKRITLGKNGALVQSCISTDHDLYIITCNNLSNLHRNLELSLIRHKGDYSYHIEESALLFSISFYSLAVCTKRYKLT